MSLTQSLSHPFKMLNVMQTSCSICLLHRRQRLMGQLLKIVSPEKGSTNRPMARLPYLREHHLRRRSHRHDCKPRGRFEDGWHLLVLCTIPPQLALAPPHPTNGSYSTYSTATSSIMTQQNPTQITAQCYQARPSTSSTSP